MTDNDALMIWTICENPRDFPGKFTARPSAIRKSGAEMQQQVLVADRLEPLREKMIEMGLTCLARHPTDDPVIVEVWL